MAAEGDFTVLPASVLDCIVNFLDVETLAAFCCSCREWYEYLNANESIWEKACKNSGLKETKDTHPRDWVTWKEYALLIIKRLKAMRNSECFRRSHFNIDMADDGGVHAIYYYKNRLAVATPEKIGMWCTTSHRLLFNIVDFQERKMLFTLSVKFDDLHIMVGDFWNRIRRFGVSSQREEVVYQGGNRRLLSYDFDSRCDIVVGKYNCDIIQIWKLLSGKPVKRMTFASNDQRGNVKIVFIRSPTTNERGLLYLLYLGIENLFMWTVTFSGDISGDGMEYVCSDNVKRLDVDHPLWFKSARNKTSISSLLNHGSFVYFSQPSASESCVINELDLNTGEISGKIKTNERIINLLAVGEKYVAFQTARENGEIILVIEKTSSKLVATYAVPVSIMTYYYGERFNVEFCDGNWLDGLDLTNDRGVLSAYVWKDEKVYFVEWIPRS